MSWFNPYAEGPDVKLIAQYRKEEQERRRVRDENAPPLPNANTPIEEVAGMVAAYYAYIYEQIAINTSNNKSRKGKRT